MKNEKKSYAVCRFLTGALLAVLTFWAVGIVFCRNYSQLQYLPELKRNVWLPGQNIHMTREGFADTQAGEDGAIAPDAEWESTDEIILLLGNSFAEGMHVADQYKLHRVINASLAQAGFKARVINVAMSSQSVADNLWQLPHYLEKYGAKIRAVVIVLAGNSYAIHPVPSVYTAGGYCAPDGKLALVPPPPQTAGRFGKIKYQFRLNSFLILGKIIKELQLNFMPGPHAPEIQQHTASQPPEESAAYQKAWIEYLAQTASQPTLLVWSEHPSIQDGQIVPATHAPEYGIVCQNADARGIDVIDLTETFNAFALQEKKMVTGLLNTPPGTGHWNTLGHKIAGEAIAAWCCRVLSNQAQTDGESR